MTTHSEIEKFLAGLEEVEALVVGDLMLDEYLWGKAERISPEAPVQVVDLVREDLRLGGAGNVIENLIAIGCRVHVASALGDDGNGTCLRQLMERRGIGTEGIFTARGRVTCKKTRILASNQQMLRIDRESREPISSDLESKLVEYLQYKVPSCRVVLVSDYLKGVLTPGLLAELMSISRRAGVPVIVDPKGTDFGKYRGATLLTPNRKEAQAASRIEITDEESLVRAGRELRRSLDLEALVLTRSEEGMTVFLRDDREQHLATVAQEVFDVSGAGDTVLAFLGAGMARGMEVREAAMLANLAAGVVVGKVGTSAVTPREIMDAVSRQSPDGERKIVSRTALSFILETERQKNRKIVFTNGCFDLLHVGHVKYLQKARRLGDLLVLGVNSDASIRRLKGPLRPLIGEDERAHILAALDCVDFVVLFDEDTPLDLIRAVRPQVLVKGGDYRPEEVVGREFVESHGGRLELIRFVDGKSTTGIIEKILQQYGEE